MKKIKIIIFSFLLSVMILPVITSAATSTATSSRTLMGRLQTVASVGGFQTDPTKASTPVLVGRIIGAFLSFLGLTFIVLTVIAGYSWMTAQGNEEQVAKARETLKNSIIGIVVAISAWSIWYVVFEKIILMR